MPLDRTVLVVVAALPPPAPARDAAWLDDLPAAEQARLRARPEPARRRSLLASRLLAEALRRIDAGGDGGDRHLSPASARSLLAGLTRSPRGRPALDGPIRFSISHAGDRSVCAVSRDMPVGIDLERVGELDGAAFPHYLSAAERAWAGCDRRRFCALWTGKEAVVKAAGDAGLAAVARVAMRFEAGGIESADFAGGIESADFAGGIDSADFAGGIDSADFAGACWTIRPVAVGPGHVCHVALPDGEAVSCKLVVVTLTDLR